MAEIKKNKTILFAEDDEQIRWITSEILKSEGYDVFDVENGELAYNLVLKKKQEIDILLTDLHMPKMKGLDLIEKVLAKMPKMKILISSGYISNVEEGIDIVGKKIPVLIKPYTRSALLKKIINLG
ncbi:MAG: response regulator [Candidatus Marinimicrobia bacterium]|nr:response regulator [Candidatus Neomarinimicrobiota bacterium]